MANKPNNPALWSKAKSLAKQKFDVYPCVPLDSEALTKQGWKKYHDLTVGEEILSYNRDTGLNEWTPILALQYFKDAPLIRLYKAQTNCDVRCTPNHKWVLDSTNAKYPDSLVEAQDITTHMKIKTSAPIKAEDQPGVDLQVFSKSDSWVKKVLMMSVPQLQAFFASGIVYDGNDKGLTAKGDKQTFGFSQKNSDHGDAMEIAAVLLGYRVCSIVKKHNPSMRTWTFITRSFESTQNLKKEDAGIEDVWCPTTKNQTWVMRQNGYVTITGNSAYANGWAAKWYKSKGGTWRKAEYGMEIMKQGGTNNPGFEALPDYVQAKILSNMAYGGMSYPFMQKGGEPDGEMALGQIAAVVDKMDKLRKFIQPGSDLEPWISSKLAVMDHYADAVSDYMMYNPEAQEEMMEEPEGLPMQEMKDGGGIPQRYKNMGFTKVGVKKESTRPGKKWMVLAKKGDQYKVVHGGYDGMKDYTQHGSEKRRDRFWDRMGGKNSAKAKDPFSPLYWHKRLGTWEDGGDIELPKYQIEGRVQRAANAQLRRNEKCDAFGDPYMGGAAGGGGRDAVPVYKNPFESLSDISNDTFFDKEAIKAVRKNRPKGVDEDMWNAINAEARRVNNLYTNKHAWQAYDKLDPATGRLDNKYLSDEYRGTMNIPEYYRYYNRVMGDKRSIGPQDIYQHFLNQPGGLETFRNMINNNYMIPKQKKGGSTFSGNAWYRSGGGVPCYECGGMYTNGGTNLRDAMYMQFLPMAQNGMQAPPRQEDYPDFGSWKSDYDAYIAAGNNPDAYYAQQAPAAPQSVGTAAYSMMPDERDFPDYESYAAAVDQWMASTTQAAAPMPAAMAPTPTPAPAAAPAKKAAAPINYSGVSIVDLLTSVGKASDYNSRKQLAAQMGIDNYYGSAQQNLQLIKMITSRPDVLDDYKPSAAPRSAKLRSSGSGSRSGSKPGAPKTASAAIASAPVTAAPAPGGTASSMFTPAFFENQKKNFLAANPNISPEQYDLMMMPRDGGPTIGPSSKPLPAGPARDPMYYDDSYILNQIKNDPGTPANIRKRKQKEFVTNLAIGTLAPWMLEGALMAATTRYLPYGLKALPEVTAAARQASKALPYATRALPYKQGGIHIDPAKRGTFKAQATRMGMGVQEAASAILNAPEGRYSPEMRKKANFARNFAKKQGGPVEGDVMDVTPEQLEMLRAQGYQFEII